MASKKKSRIIALVDMDCFYVQVVQRNDPSLAGKPCAVVQYKAWRGGGIIAVGYEARKFGVTRQMRGDDAKQKCPEISLVHVPESRGKADLTQFREAGAEVMSVLAKFTDCLERASIDEAYMDLSKSVNSYIDRYTLEDIAVLTFQTTHLVGFENEEFMLEKEQIVKMNMFQQWLNLLRTNETNFQLAVGAVIANDMRNAVKDKTGFSCSAGIGPNKVLAKVVAGFHKPNQQTLILPEKVGEMFQTTQIRKVRNLGGKLGSQLEEKCKVHFMAELCKFSLNSLQSHVGTKNGELVYWLCRGINNEPVRPRQLPKSVGCSKNFRGKEMLVTKSDVNKWLNNLVEEVWERLEKEKEINNRVATLFTVGCWNEKKQNQSKRVTIMKDSIQVFKSEAFRTLCDMNKSQNGDLWSPGLTNLSFCASKFEITGSAGLTDINKYMCLDKSISVGKHNMIYTGNENVYERPIFSQICDKKNISNYFLSPKHSSETNKQIESNCNTHQSSVPCNDQHIKKTINIKANKLKAFIDIENQNLALNTYQMSEGENRDESLCLFDDIHNDSNKTFLPEDPLDFSYQCTSSGNITKKNSIKQINVTQTSSNSYSIPLGNSINFNSNSLPQRTSFQEKYQSDKLKLWSASSSSSNGNDNCLSDVEQFDHSQNKSLIKKTSRSNPGNKSLQKGYFEKLKLDYLNTDSKKFSDGPTSSLTNIPSIKEKDSMLQNLVDDSNLKKNIEIKSKIDGILTSSNDVVNSLASEDVMLCEKCNDQILVWDFPEHMDFHYAKDIQESMKRDFFSLYNNLPSDSFESPKKKKTKKSNSMRNYFSSVKK